MADNNNVFILFEEIKTTLNGIKSKLEELPDVADRQPQIGNDKPDLSPIKEAVVETTKAQSEEIKDLLAMGGLCTGDNRDFEANRFP